MSTTFHLICDICQIEAFVCDNHGYFNDEELKPMLLQHRWNCNGKLSLITEDELDKLERLPEK
jgi:hypothetical protein